MSRMPWFVTFALAAALAGGCKKQNESSPDKTTATAAAPEAGDDGEGVPDAPEAARPAPPPTPEMAMPKVGDPAPAFETVAHDGTKVSVAELAGEPFVLYFYPRDDTPG